MTRSALFWIIMIILFICGVGNFYGHTEHYSYWWMGMSVVQFVLIGLLGWQVYGPAIKSG
jgi:hypothetical protein